MVFIKNITSAFASQEVAEVENDRADLVQTVLLIAGFAIAALAVVNWLSSAILNKAADASQCIEGSNTYNSAASSKNCEDANHSSKNSFKTDSAYQGRYK